MLHFCCLSEKLNISLVFVNNNDLFLLRELTLSSFYVFTAVTIGITIATYNETEFVLIGFIYQISSMVCEAVRLQLIQILMQGKKLNPIQTLFYLSPACFVCLLIPFSLIEANSVRFLIVTREIYDARQHKCLIFCDLTLCIPNLISSIFKP